MGPNRLPALFPPSSSHLRSSSSRKGIVAKVKAGGPLKSAVFNAAFSLKKRAGISSYVGGLLDALVFKAVKEATGGRLMYGVNGGAALSRDTQEYLSTALVIIIQGCTFPLLLLGLCFLMN